MVSVDYGFLTSKPEQGSQSGSLGGDPSQEEGKDPSTTLVVLRARPTKLTAAMVVTRKGTSKVWVATRTAERIDPLG